MSKMVLLTTTGLLGLCALSVGAASLSTTPSGSSNSALTGVGNLKYTGVNIAGFDFGVIVFIRYVVRFDVLTLLHWI